MTRGEPDAAPHRGSGWIRISGAREHNLKNINVAIPKHAITVFTGVSGSGKSSLVFETIEDASAAELRRASKRWAAVIGEPVPAKSVLRRISAGGGGRMPWRPRSSSRCERGGAPDPYDRRAAREISSPPP